MRAAPGRLFVVATPIGNLGDISARAAEVLGRVDRILAEDTRHTRRLLAHLGLSTPLESLHVHNEGGAAASLADEMAAGLVAALVSDAGTPGISDPGSELVREVRSRGIPVESVAGPSALAAAVAVSGFSSRPMIFLGFPPSRVGERRRFLSPWLKMSAMLVMFEAPHRILKTLVDLEELGANDRPAILLRELTKVHEEGIDGTVESIRADLASRDRVRGELVLILGRPSGIGVIQIGVDEELAAELERRIESGEQRRSAFRALARERGISRAELQRRLARGTAPR